ncbi:MAG: hypothetical protein KGM17_01055 [Sphingomonadales bacterium]|nr:hypothetical protein [Sphingomonadales bacterium]
MSVATEPAPADAPTTDMAPRRAFYDSFLSIMTVFVAHVVVITAIVIWLISRGHH